MNQKGRILALDYGTRKVGVAITDPLQITAAPLTTIRYSNQNSLLNRILDLVKEKEVQRIIVGLPVTLSGGKSDMTKSVETFVNELAHHTDIPVATFDERHTSSDAKQTLIEMGIKTGHNKERIDAMAAAHLLRYYMDEQGL
jgi:putative Holliday junction resolvase